MEQTVTAKIRIKSDSQAKQMLEQVISVYKNACNFVADYVFETHQLKQILLQKAVYNDLRDKFGLKSQIACNVPRTVIANFKSNKSNTLLVFLYQWIIRHNNMFIVPLYSE